MGISHWVCCWGLRVDDFTQLTDSCSIFSMLLGIDLEMLSVATSSLTGSLSHAGQKLKSPYVISLIDVLDRGVAL